MFKFKMHDWIAIEDRLYEVSGFKVTPCYYVSNTLLGVNCEPKCDYILSYLTNYNVEEMKLSKEYVEKHASLYNNDAPNEENKTESNIHKNNSLVDRHKELCNELNKTYELKNKKYGDSFGSSVKEFGYIAALTRISDKYNRMKQLILSKEDGSDTDERLEDTLLDMANYCIMTVMELQNKE